MIHLDNLVNFNFDIVPLEAIAIDLLKKHDRHEDIELIVSDNTHLRNLNQAYRDKDGPTDVLSFPMDSSDPLAPLGSIVISADFAKEKAVVFQHSIQDEITLLFTHGLLHLLGYDHENDENEMRDLEHHIISEYNLPKSLIIRVEES